MITPGSFGAKRASANSATSPTSPTATVVHSQLPTSAMVFTSTDSVSPDGFSIPTTFGSWPIAMYRPSPTMKPSSTGRAKKRATKPIRARPPAM